MVTWLLPKLPLLAISSALVNTVIAGLARTFSSSVAIRSAPLRPCGNMGPKPATRPPSWASFSTRKTVRPISASPRAARRPAMPPPTTRLFGVVSTTIGSSGSVRRVRLMPARTRRTAFSVAPTLSSVCVQEHCSRTFTWVYWNGFMPARFATSRNVTVCSLGEHEATTSASRPCSWASCTISCWVASEQVNIAERATTTSSSPLISSTTLSTST